MMWYKCTICGKFMKIEHVFQIQDGTEVHLSCKCGGAEIRLED